MAASNGQFMSYLDPKQQDLLTAALNSNNPGQNGLAQQLANDPSMMNGQFNFDGVDPSLFFNNNNLAMPNFDANGAMEDSPFLDNVNYDDNFEFDFNDADGQMIGDMPGDSPEEEEQDSGDLHDKRKSPDGEKEDNENGGKRREGDQKEAKKPGRKPLTSEPTNKRKAQNRAAQRAFRERKEKHLKDLETKVQELEKASEATNHENGLLRAQVDRLQIELREYRKRLSLNSGLLGRTPPTANNIFNQASSSNNSFQFDFPRFGSLPGGVFGSGNAMNKASPASSNVSGQAKTPANAPNRTSSNGRSISPRSQARANGSMSSGTSPAQTGSTMGTPEQSNGTMDSMSSMFTPAGGVNGLGGTSALDYNNWITTTTSAEPESTTNGQANPSRIFQFNSNSASSASPGSTSSMSQYNGGANSSCGTSPEPSHSSPKNSNLDTITECHTIQTSDGANANDNATPNNDPNGFNSMASENGGGFDPQLFDTYREPQSAIVGDGDFTGGFFNDALPTMDFASPFDWANITAPTGLTPSVQKSNPLEVADALTAGLDVVQEEDEVVPADEPGALLTCHKIWDKLQDRPDFKDGSLDIDGLCSELRQKARCSESGVVIDQKDVDHALKRLSPSNGGPAPAPAVNKA